MKKISLLCLLTLGALILPPANAYALGIIDPSVRLFDWVMIPVPGSGGAMEFYCFEDPHANQVIASIWQSAESRFHPAELISATSQINAVLGRVSAANSDKTRELSFIKFGGRQFLVWARKEKGKPTRAALLRSTDSLPKIAKALNIPLVANDGDGVDWPGRAFLELGGQMYCFKYPFPDCTVVIKPRFPYGGDLLWEASSPTDGHPAELNDATKTINGILKKVAATNRDPERHLCLISYDDRLFLAWSKHVDKRPAGGVDARSPKKDVYKALGLRAD